MRSIYRLSEKGYGKFRLLNATEITLQHSSILRQIAMFFLDNAERGRTILGLSSRRIF